MSNLEQKGKSKSSEVRVKINEKTKTIEDKAEKKEGFSKKRIILLIVFTILSIVVAGLTIKFVLNINWTNLFASISHGFERSMGFLWFFLLIFYLIHTIINNFLVVWLRLRKLGFKIPLGQWLILGMSSAFFRAVTPTIMSDTYTLVWMKTNGVPTYRVTSMLFSNTLFWQVIQLCVTFPSFVFVLCYRNLFFASADGIAVFTLLVIGIIIDFFSCIFMFLLCWSRRVHYTLSRIFNWFKKKLHMKYHTKAEIEQKYKDKAVIKQDFIDYLKDWKTTTLIIFFFVFAEIITYIAVAWSMYFVQYVHYSDGHVYKVSFDFWWAFHSTNVTFTANRLNFLIPNGEGSLEYILRTFLSTKDTWSFDPSMLPTGAKPELVKSIIDNGILIWRFFGAIAPAFLGIFALAYWVIKKATDSKKGKKFIQEEKPLNANLK